MTETKTLQLEFLDSLGKSKTISLANPKEELTYSEVRNASDTILAQQIFCTENGPISSLKTAEVVTKQVTVLE